MFKRTAISIVGGTIITVLLYATYLSAWEFGSLGMIVKVLLWPLATCMYLAGPGPTIGPPEKHMHEGTPVHILAFFGGIVASWMFYSWLIFVIMEIRARRSVRKPSPPA